MASEKDFSGAHYKAPPNEIVFFKTILGIGFLLHQGTLGHLASPPKAASPGPELFVQGSSWPTPTSPSRSRKQISAFSPG